MVNGWINKEELRSALLNLNLDLSQQILDDFIEVDDSNVDEENPRSDDTYSQENFIKLLTLILSNQSTFFREIYNGKTAREVDLQAHLKQNNANIRLCFDVYDNDKSGYLDYMELRTLLTEMNMHKQFARHWNPQYAFENFVAGVIKTFDRN